MLLLIITCIVTGSEISYASTPYKTYTIDGYGYVTETQSAYMPDASITKVGEDALLSPSDMVVTEDGFIYIADTGSKKVLVSDLEGNYIRTIGEGELTAPTGIYVTKDKTLYVADKDGKKVVVFDEEGNKIQEYGKPDHPLYGESMDFKPQKLVVNKSGNMYIICEGNTNGIVQIAPTNGGTFIGYFGTNYTSVSLLEVFQRAIFTDEQKAKMLSKLPSTPTNLSIDESGLIYTVTQGDYQYTLKKLNIAGSNLIVPDAYDELPASVTTGAYDNIYVASQDGYIYEYNSDGELLFVFGGRDDGRGRIGLCDKVAAIGVDNESNLYLLDAEKKQVQIFKPTEFTNLLHESLFLYEKGRYTESKEPLTQVLEMNSLFDYANKAMCRAYLQEENYGEALKYARLAKDFDGYSDAFWEVRNQWIRDNLILSMGVLILVFACVQVLKRLQKKKGIFNPLQKKVRGFYDRLLVKQMVYSRYFMKHPVDGCYGVKREQKASYLCANLILLGVIILSIIGKYGCGFLLKTVRDGQYDLIGDAGTVIVIFLMLIACNYLMCTINEGEGTFKQLYCAYAYALTPYIFIKPIVILLSNVITYSEVFLVQLTNYIMISWIAVLLFIALKEINDYTIRSTIKILLLTIFTVLIAALLIFIIYILFTQVLEFVVTIAGEVVYRLET
ncbi:YIP1 family protein [Anaeromicropila populeti]|uniref:YIP1 family protein n=1 Tax=Anaeromicropila populeti TaxID=37658 RepID=UPI001FA8765C|nr:YIP1 family protein [Anaeromicropila populeti]